MTGKRSWPVHLSEAAKADYRNILDWTAEQFGEAQHDIYAQVLDEAIAALMNGPDTRGVVPRADIAPGLLCLRVARQGHRGRHLLVCRARHRNHEEIIEILRILHDSMDLARHLPPSSDE
ncbi:MAG TPA: type II toxin-antitoxin system RelE/ParE family toxin [Micropepsaceae bacterium]|jgi:toxin ParE1/3/4|nr:type II toxin-antitoxin system RelE/ParE family toxin [Micropepsaceae bacterium]